MKSSEFETSLLESGELLKRSFVSLISNVGKTTAIITLAVAALVTFTDISFYSIGTESFTSALALMLIASYLMFFSLEEAGERLGEESDEFKSATLEYKQAAAKIMPQSIGQLREFCSLYALEEFRFRKESLIASAGYSKEEYEAYKRGGAADRRMKRIFKKADSLKMLELTPRLLLEREHTGKRSELQNPEGGKFKRLFIRLIPTTACMIFTASIMLGTKEGLTAGTIIESILRLAALPIVGFRGYAIGYSHAKVNRTAWIETKTRILKAFLSKAE